MSGQLNRSTQSQIESKFQSRIQSGTDVSIGIAGAGVMGRVLAWQLLQAGFQVSLFDKDPLCHGEAAAYTAAGMLTPYCEVESAELSIYQMGIRSLELWRQLAIELDADIGHFQLGSLVVAHHNDKPDYQQFQQHVMAKLSPSPAQFQQLNSQQLSLLEPELAERFSEAIYLPEEAWLCPEKIMSVLAEKLQAQGVNWHQETAVTELKSGLIKTKHGSHRFDWVIDCRGLGAKHQWQELRGVRGELIWLQAPDVNIKHLVRLMHPRYRLYLVPKGVDDLYVIGATQIESNDKGAITVRSSLELLSAVYSLHAGFSEARIVDMRTNCRPALNDNLPKIKIDKGLLQVNGLYRHGFLLAPVLAEKITRWLLAPDAQSTYLSLTKRAC